MKQSSKSPFFNGIKIYGEEVINGDSLGLPFEIILIDNFLVIYDEEPINGNQIKLYNNSSFSLLHSYGRYGSGPGELNMAFSLNYVFNRNKDFSIFDASNLRLTVYRINNKKEISVKKMINMERGMPYTPIIVNDTSIVSLDYSMSEAGRFSEFDINGKFKCIKGEMLPGKQKNVPINIHQQASKGIIRFNPSGTKYVITAVFTDIIDVFDSNGKLLKRIIGPVNQTPKYSVGNSPQGPMLKHTNEEIIGYLDVEITEDKIYALFSGDHYHGIAGKYIHVFDYNGTLLKTYNLNPGIYQFAFDKANNRLYGIQLEGAPKILMFKLIN